jgi:hypothetical protein
VLKELLSSLACTLVHLDLSGNPALEGPDIMAGLRLNQSLTSVSLSGVSSANSETAHDMLGASLLLDENKCRLGLFSCDAFQVTEYFGVRDGSRHRVRLSAAHKGNEGSADAKPPMVLDLNESNHGKLLFPSVSTHAEARAGYCRKLAAKHALLCDEATGKDLRVAYQRFYLKPPDEETVHAPSGAAAEVAAATGTPAEAAGGAGEAALAEEAVAEADAPAAACEAAAARERHSRG